MHDDPYNHIKKSNYAGLIQAFNAEDGPGGGMRVATRRIVCRSDQVARANHDRPTLTICEIAHDDCTADLISWDRQVTTAAESGGGRRRDFARSSRGQKTTLRHACGYKLSNELSKSF